MRTQHLRTLPTLFGPWHPIAQQRAHMHALSCGVLIVCCAVLCLLFCSCAVASPLYQGRCARGRVWTAAVNRVVSSCLLGAPLCKTTCQPISRSTSWQLQRCRRHWCKDAVHRAAVQMQVAHVVGNWSQQSSCSSTPGGPNTLGKCKCKFPLSQLPL